MPSKKKKYNSRFPPARIKKIMQTDEEIGKVAAAVPVLISKCLEMFLASLLTKAGEVTKSKRAKTMSRIHLKECIMSETMFDFLKDQVSHIQDLHGDEEQTISGGMMTETDSSAKVIRKRSLSRTKKVPRKKAKLGDESDHESDAGDGESDNGSENEKADTSYSSSALLSPVIQRKLDEHSTLSGGYDDGEPNTSEQKPSIHIPLDILMASSDIPVSVSVEKPVHGQKRDLKYSSPNSDVEAPITSTSASAERRSDLTNSQARKGVIVTNSSAYNQPGIHVSGINEKSTMSPSDGVNAALLAAQKVPQSNDQGLSINEKDSKVLLEKGYLKIGDMSSAALTPHESMLSLLHSPMPLVVSETSNPSTVQDDTIRVSRKKYAYNPLTQQPRQPILYPGTSASTNGSQGPIGYCKQVPPYVPPATQRHFLGYPQSMLTPTAANPLMAVHSGMAQMKPAPRTRSEDDDDYDT